MPSELGISSPMWHTDSRRLLKETLDFGPASKKFVLHDGSIPRNYQVLLPDKQVKASESPDTRKDDSSPYEESSTTTSSPLSYTKELTNVSSPLTPLSDARRSKSKSPSQLAASNSKFLEDDDELEEETEETTLTAKNLNGSNGVNGTNGSKEDAPAISNNFIEPVLPMPATPSKLNTSDRSNGHVEKEKRTSLFSSVFSSPIKPKVMTIKIGKETTMKKELPSHSLVPYSTESSSESESDEEQTPKINVKPPTPVKKRDPSPHTIIGPLKPSKLPLPELKPITLYKRSGEALTSPAVSKRKRLLSERGEKEMAYPVMDKDIISSWNWTNFSPVIGKSRGAGLFNSSNDCFLNAILQVVAHTAPLCRYLMERHDSHSCPRPSGQCVACALCTNHLRRVVRDSSNGFMASWIRSHLRRIFPSHMHGMQEDAHELLALLLDAIDPPMNNNKNNVINGMNTKPSTPIEQIFGGTLRNQVTCDTCGSTYTNYERIRELNLAIKKARQDMDHSKISFLIDHYFRDENVNAFDCKHCARKTTATRKTKILRPPAVLLVQLKRFNAFGQKIRLPVTPEIDVDLSKYMFDGAPTSCTEYVLTAVVEHLGSTVDHGHYIAFCRGFDHKQWYLFDDDSVIGVANQKVTASNPYLLVYSRREDMPFNPMKKADPIRQPNHSFAGGSMTSKPNGFAAKLNGYNNGNFNRQQQQRYRYGLI